MRAPRLGAKSELQLPVYTTATAMRHPSCICDLHHSSRQYRTLNSLSKARDRTWVLTDAGQICFNWTMTGTPHFPVNRSTQFSLLVPLGGSKVESVSGVANAEHTTQEWEDPIKPNRNMDLDWDLYLMKGHGCVFVQPYMAEAAGSREAPSIPGTPGVLSSHTDGISGVCSEMFQTKGNSMFHEKNSTIIS